MKGSDRDFHVLETDEYVALASSLVAGVRFVYKSVSIRPASLRAPRSVGYHSVGCPLCDLSGGGDEVRRNDASADRLVRRRRGGGQRKNRKNLLVHASGLLRAVGFASRRRRRKRTLASSFNLMSRYLSSLSKLSAPTGFGFPSYAWCTRYCTPPIAVMAPTMMANGGKDSNGCDWFRATTARRRGGKACVVSAARGALRVHMRRHARCARAHEDAASPSSGRRRSKLSAPRPSRGS